MPAAAETTPEFEQMQFDLEVAESAAASAGEPLAQAIARAKADASSAQVFDERREALEAARAGVADAIEKIAVARGSAKVAAYHGASVRAQGAVIVAAVKRIAALERGMLKLDAEAERRIDALRLAANRQDDRDDEYLRGVAELGDRAAAADADRESIRLALETCKANAERAVERRHAPGLELAQADARGLALRPLAARAKDLAALAARLEALNGEVGHEARTQRMRDFGVARGRCRRLATEVPQMLAMAQALAAMKLAPLDIARALKVLGLPADRKPTLAKALAQPPAQRAKALDALAAGTSGKAMLDTLARAHLI